MSPQTNEKDEVKTNDRQLSNLLIFISHDSKDAEIAEAFGKLLKSVSMGFLKSFRSSDKKEKMG